MKNLGLGLLVTSFLSVAAIGSDLDCYKNSGDDGRVKTVCFLRNAKSQTKGFLLFNANGSKTYLAVTRTTPSGYASQEYGSRKWTYTVKLADSELNPKSTETSKVVVSQWWQYSDGGTRFYGQTPGGIKFSGLIESGDHE